MQLCIFILAFSLYKYIYLVTNQKSLPETSVIKVTFGGGMASILRSSKFVRYIAGFARNVVLNTPREFDGNLVNTTQCLCGAANR